MSERSPVFVATVLIFLASTATIAAAWGFELIGGYKPCPLCLQQRWPYYIVMVATAALLALLLSAPQRAPWARRALVIVALVFVAGSMLGLYHAGIEWGWWLGPASCTGGGGITGVLPDLDNAPLVLCNEAQWRLLGLSFAGWNFFISLELALVALWGARRPAA